MVVAGINSRGLQCQTKTSFLYGTKLMAAISGIILFTAQICGSLATPIGNSLSVMGSMMPTIVALDVKCGRSGMNVHVTFDGPFHGVIYSKGFYDEDQCHYVTEKNTNRDSFVFYLPVNACGTSGSLEDPTIDKDMYFDNTIVIQNDPLIQEIWDQARNLRCTWQHTLSKSVESKPIKVAEPEKVKVSFDSKSINTMMQIQQGKSPFSSPVTGYVYVGDDTSVVIYVQDSSNKLDATVVSCQASSKSNKVIELIDANGCLLRPDLMTPFTKLITPDGVPANLMMFANLKAFQVDKDEFFRISCNLEVCEGKCLEPCALSELTYSRSKRQVSMTELIELHGGAVVVAKERDNDSKCSLTTFIAITVIILVFVCSLLCCISCYLALKLHSLRSKLHLSVKH